MTVLQATFAFGFTAALLLIAVAAYLQSRSKGAVAMRVSPGDKVRDKVSGATGIVMCRSEWQYGCVRLTVQPQEVKDGKPAELFTIDEPQAEVLKVQAVPDTAREPQQARTHGDRPAASRAAEASRR